jgi:hypothetical protein
VAVEAAAVVQVVFKVREIEKVKKMTADFALTAIFMPLKCD